MPLTYNLVFKLIHLIKLSCLFVFVSYCSPHLPPPAFSGRVGTPAPSLGIGVRNSLHPSVHHQHPLGMFAPPPIRTPPSVSLPSAIASSTSGVPSSVPTSFGDVGGDPLFHSPVASSE